MLKTKGSPNYKVSRTGMWQPYIPKLGVSPGCRVGVRNDLENFQHMHIAQRYQDSQALTKSDQSNLPQAAKSSFDRGTVVPSIETQHVPIKQPRTYGPVALQQGLIPLENESNIAVNRPHRGKTSYQSFSIFSDSIEDIQTDPVRIRRNDRTIRPSDNIGTGLLPTLEMSGEIRMKMRAPNDVRLASSLGPGLMSFGIEPNVPDTGENVAEHPETYRRVYGLKEESINELYDVKPAAYCKQNMRQSSRMAQTPETKIIFLSHRHPSSSNIPSHRWVEQPRRENSPK